MTKIPTQEDIDHTCNDLAEKLAKGDASKNDVKIALVDVLCAAAELVMGKTIMSPMAIIKNYQFDSKDDQISNLIRPGSDDLFK